MTGALAAMLLFPTSRAEESQTLTYETAISESREFRELARVEVFDGNEPVQCLHELEFVDGKIYGNEYPQDRVAIIQPDSGQVTGWIDLAGLKSSMPPLPLEPLTLILNGIAYDAAGDRLFVTGKFWPKVFEVRLRRGDASPIRIAPPIEADPVRF